MRPGEVDLVGVEDVRRLAGFRSRPCVSFFLPTHRAGPETRQDPLRLKNLLRDAHARLAALGFAAREADELLEPVEALLDDSPFWLHQADGLAVFVASGLSEHYRLPMEVEELAVVGDRFHLAPLLPLLTGDGHFFVLAVSQKDVRLLEGTRLTVAELNTPGLPAGLTEALGDVEGAGRVQVHSAEPTGRGERSVMFHGHGGGEEDKKEQLERYFRVIDRAVADRLAGERAPLVLAGVDYYLPLYRSVSVHPNLLPGAVTGNPDDLTAAELHARAWPLVEPLFEAQRNDALESYRARRGTGAAVSSVPEVVAAAAHGRVETLLVANSARLWGRCGDDGSVDLDAGDHETLDVVDVVGVTASRTLLTSGIVLSLDEDEMPEGEAMGALLRY